jgi:hypothetical protein
MVLQWGCFAVTVAFVGIDDFFFAKKKCSKAPVRLQQGAECHVTCWMAAAIGLLVGRVSAELQSEVVHIDSCPYLKSVERGSCSVVCWVCCSTYYVGYSARRRTCILQEEASWSRFDKRGVGRVVASLLCMPAEQCNTWL